MTLRNRLTDALMRSMNLVHRGLLAVSGGRLGRTIGPMPAVELHTIGRRSGKRRSTMLTSPIHDDNQYVLVASMGGDDRNPQWYLNLVANPNVELEVNGQTLQMHARTASAAERAELWPRLILVNPGYAGYQSKTSREIPVVICEIL